MNRFSQFRSILPEKRSELVLRSIGNLQQLGAFADEAQVRATYRSEIDRVRMSGSVVSGAPVYPYEILGSESFHNYFRAVADDLEILFDEIDHSEIVLDGLDTAVHSEVERARQQIGEIKAEFIRRQIRHMPGSGWSRVFQDQFEQGHANLLDPSELDDNVFGNLYAGRATTFQYNVDVNETGHKMVLPTSAAVTHTLENARLIWDNTTTESTIPIRNDISVVRAIDGQDQTFWAHTVAVVAPIVGSGMNTTVHQIAGISGLLPTIDTTDLERPYRQDFYVRIIEPSGTDPRYVVTATQDDYAGPVCRHDLGGRCRFNYELEYSPDCSNRYCARHETPGHLLAGTTSGILDDGFEVPTGATITFPSVVDLEPGQVWQVSMVPSGIAGARLRLEVDFARPASFNWIELTPLADLPYVIDQIEVLHQGATTYTPLLASGIILEDQTRLDFAMLDAEALRFDLRQPTYRTSSLRMRSEQQALSRLSELDLEGPPISIADLDAVPLDAILAKRLPNGILQSFFTTAADRPFSVDGFLYSFGLFDLRCGLSTYQDSALGVTRPLRAATPSMFTIRTDLTVNQPILEAYRPSSSGTIEMTVIRFDYDESNRALGRTEIPVPVLDSDGTILERAFPDTTGSMNLRFLAASIDSILILSNNRELTTSEYEITSTTAAPRQTSILLLDDTISEANVILVRYTPLYGVDLDLNSRHRLMPNNTFQNSTTIVPFVVLCGTEHGTTPIAYSDFHLKTILHRNDLDPHTTPALRDYQILVSEDDPGRFF